MHRKHPRRLAAVAALLLLTACAGADEAEPEASAPAAPEAPAETTEEEPAGPSADDCEAGIEFRIAHHLGDSVVGHLAFEQMVLDIEAGTDGRITGAVYPAGQLGGIAEWTDLLNAGVIEFAWVDTSHFGNFIPGVGFANLPFLFNNEDEFHQIMDGPIGQDIDAQLRDELGVEMLGWSSVGALYPFFAGKTVETVDDLAGTKIRVAAATVTTETWRLLGTETFSMPLGEAYTALQTGSVEAYHLPYWATRATKLYEVSDSMSEIPVNFANLGIATSVDWLGGLCEFDQQVIREAATTATQANRDGWPAADVTDREYLIEQGIEMIPVSDLEPFRALVLPQWEQFEADSAEDYFTRARAELGR